MAPSLLIKEPFAISITQMPFDFGHDGRVQEVMSVASIHQEYHSDAL